LHPRCTNGFYDENIRRLKCKKSDKGAESKDRNARIRREPPLITPGDVFWAMRHNYDFMTYVKFKFHCVY
jgi:hypothetical protein